MAGAWRRSVAGAAVVAALAASAAALPAVEPTVADLRLLAEVGPTSYDYRWDTPRGSRAGEDRLDRSLAVGLGFRWARTRPGRPLGLLLGAELLACQDALAGAERTGATLRGECGLAAGLASRWTLTAAPVVGWGPGRWRLDGGAAPAAELRGYRLEAGLRAGLRFSPAPAWGVGLDGGWWWSRERADAGDAALELRRQGPCAVLSLAWTVDPVTRSLE